MQQLLEAGELVVLALVDVRDAELGHALGDDHAHARGDHRDFDVIGKQPLETETIVHVKRLELVAVLGVDQPAVGEHAVDVEDREPDARGAVADVGGEVGWGACGDYRTAAWQGRSSPDCGTQFVSSSESWNPSCGGREKQRGFRLFPECPEQT